ncbi:MAG: ribosomal-processing cysteine protease Prp [Peptoniphilus sp.]|uniref:ribosomal-processing cysteine protease Prp n=1 Tax=Peptoniphilus sp. TaxID=1971214 RepID=UPI002A75A488|nr:ribosomal-processing cysteine protease Prp [Peptoniphilus sp.]MDY2986268.1 ribosomal-processing cysteine protease Prp [Peptoniphilus sp.]
MVEITLYREDDLYFGFRSKGHADYGNSEYDIVCAGVSILTQTLYFQAINNLGIAEGDIYDEQDSGYLKIVFKNKSDYIKLQDSFLFLIEGLSLLEKNYSEHVMLKVDNNSQEVG